ncbi:MAG: sulfurtransferase TusA family protein [Chloroflexia bacterium]
MTQDDIQPDVVVDAGPLGCGELLVLLHMETRNLQPGQIFEAITYDPGAREDLPAWCRLLGHTLLGEQSGHYFIRKGPTT